MKRTEVELTLTIKHKSDEEYQKIISEIEMMIRNCDAVDSLSVGVGYEEEDEDDLIGDDDDIWNEGPNGEASEGDKLMTNGDME